MSFDRTLLSVAALTLSALGIAICEPDGNETQKAPATIPAGIVEIEEEFTAPQYPLRWDVPLPQQGQHAVTDLFVDFAGDRDWVEPMELTIEINGETQWQQLMPRERTFHLTFPSAVRVHSGESLTITLCGGQDDLPLRLLVHGRHITR